jgi:ketosteroid isomerase-like protein
VDSVPFCIARAYNTRAVTHDQAVAFLRQRQAKWDRRDPAELTADHAPDGLVRSPMFADVRGRPAIELSYRKLFTVFPDWTIVFDEAIVDGDRAAHPFTVRATHVGNFMGFPGTGRQFTFSGALLYTMRDGLIVEERRVYDFSGLLIQLGVLRSKPAPVKE